ncbi:hypothetical protein RJG79_00625 [Mycoplasmatota bacterium WC44]
MKKNTINNVLCVYQLLIVEKKKYTRYELSVLLGVHVKTVSLYIRHINNFLYDNYIYKEIKYNFST